MRMKESADEFESEAPIERSSTIRPGKMLEYPDIMLLSLISN